MTERNYNFKRTRARRIWNEQKQAAIARSERARQVEKCYRDHTPPQLEEQVKA